MRNFFEKPLTEEEVRNPRAHLREIFGDDYPTEPNKENITRLYKRHCLSYHPDKVTEQDKKVKAEEIFKQFQEIFKDDNLVGVAIDGEGSRAGRKTKDIVMSDELRGFLKQVVAMHNPYKKDLIFIDVYNPGEAGLGSSFVMIGQKGGISAYSCLSQMERSDIDACIFHLYRMVRHQFLAKPSEGDNLALGLAGRKKFSEEYLGSNPETHRGKEIGGLRYMYRNIHALNDLASQSDLLQDALAKYEIANRMRVFIDNLVNTNYSAKRNPFTFDKSDQGYCSIKFDEESASFIINLKDLNDEQIQILRDNGIDFSSDITDTMTLSVEKVSGFDQGKIERLISKGYRQNHDGSMQKDTYSHSIRNPESLTPLLAENQQAIDCKIKLLAQQEMFLFMLRMNFSEFIKLMPLYGTEEFSKYIDGEFDDDSIPADKTFIPGFSGESLHDFINSDEALERIESQIRGKSLKANDLRFLVNKCGLKIADPEKAKSLILSAIENGDCETAQYAIDNLSSLPEINKFKNEHGRNVIHLVTRNILEIFNSLKTSLKLMHSIFNLGSSKEISSFDSYQKDLGREIAKLEYLSSIVDPSLFDQKDTARGKSPLELLDEIKSLRFEKYPEYKGGENPVINGEEVFKGISATFEGRRLLVAGRALTAGDEVPVRVEAETVVGRATATYTPSLPPPAEKDPKQELNAKISKLRAEAGGLMNSKDFKGAITKYDEIIATYAENSMTEEVKPYHLFRLNCYLNIGEASTTEAEESFKAIESEVFSEGGLQDLKTTLVNSYRIATTPLKNGPDPGASNVVDMLAAATFSDADSAIRKRTFKIYQELWQVEYLRPLMKVIALATIGRGPDGKIPKKLQIISSKEVVERSEREGNIGGCYLPEANKIYFNVGGGSMGPTDQGPYQEYTDQMLKGFLIHEMHHAWENLKHQNNCNPFPVGGDRARFNAMEAEVRANTTHITSALSSLRPEMLQYGIFDVSHYPEEEQLKEIVVRTPHAIAAMTGMKNQKKESLTEEGVIDIIRGNFPRAVDFFLIEERAQMIDWCQKATAKVENLHFTDEELEIQLTTMTAEPAPTTTFNRELYQQITNILAQDDINSFTALIAKKPGILDLDISSFAADANDHESQKIIHLACEAKSTKIINYLAQNYREVFLQVTRNNQFPIHILAKRGRITELKMVTRRMPGLLNQTVIRNPEINVFSLSCNEAKDDNLKTLIALRSVNKDPATFALAKNVLKGQSSRIGQSGANLQIMREICDGKYDKFLARGIDEETALIQIRRIKLNELIEKKNPDNFERIATLIDQMQDEIIANPSHNIVALRFLANNVDFYQTGDLYRKLTDNIIDQVDVNIMVPYRNGYKEPLLMAARSNYELFQSHCHRFNLDSSNSNKKTLWQLLLESGDIKYLPTLEMIALRSKDRITKLTQLHQQFDLSLAPYAEILQGQHEALPELGPPHPDQDQNKYIIKTVCENHNLFYDLFAIRDYDRLEPDTNSLKTIYLTDKDGNKRILLQRKGGSYPGEPDLYYSEFSTAELQAEMDHLPANVQVQLTQLIAELKPTLAFNAQASDSPPSVKKTPALTANTRSLSDYQEVLAQNKGLFWGDRHGSGLTSKITESLAMLKDQNVARIYVELPVADVGAMIARYNTCKPEQEDFYLKYIANFVNKRFAGDKEQMIDLIIAAKREGVEIAPIDIARRVARQSDLPSVFVVGEDGVSGEQRLLQDQAIAKFIQQQNKSLDESSKFLVFYGAAHSKIAENLGIPSVYAGPQDQFYNPTVDYDTNSTTITVTPLKSRTSLKKAAAKVAKRATFPEGEVVTEIREFNSKNPPSELSKPGANPQRPPSLIYSPEATVIAAPQLLNQEIKLYLDDADNQRQNNEEVAVQFDASLDSQNDKPKPTQAYRGCGIKASFNEENRFLIDEVFAAAITRFTFQEGGQQKTLNNSWFAQDPKKEVTAIWVDGQYKSPFRIIQDEIAKNSDNQLAGIDAGLAIIADAFHGKQETKFKVSDGKTETELSCTANNKDVFVTKDCQSARPKIVGETGDKYNPEAHGSQAIDPKGNALEIIRQKLQVMTMAR